MKIGIFVGSTFGNTRNAGYKLQNLLKALGLLVDFFDIGLINVSKLLEYNVLIVGCSTWYVGDMQDDWARQVSAIRKLDFSNKTVALFGMGDQETYADTFQDAMGDLAQMFQNGGATIVGHTKTTGYHFTDSRALTEDHFVGLALDDDNQAKLTEPRLKTWVNQLVQELRLWAVNA